MGRVVKRVAGFQVGDMVEVRRFGCWVAAKVVSLTEFSIFVVRVEDQKEVRVFPQQIKDGKIRHYVPSRALHDSFVDLDYRGVKWR